MATESTEEHGKIKKYKWLILQEISIHHGIA
jgi:hypothetical protein